MRGILDKLIKGQAALTTNNFIEANIKGGRQYYAFDEATGIPAGESVDYLFRSGPRKWTDIKFRDVQTSGPNFYVEVYEAPTVSDTGSEQISVFNWSRPLKDFRLSGATIWKNPTLTDPGELIDKDAIYGRDAAAAKNRNGDLNTEGVSRVLQPDTDYIIRIRNAGEGPESAWIKINWYEGRLVPDPDFLLSHS